MTSEQQQQRIMTYFIEEAQEHLQTIEQGVLDLQNVLADVERVNELFRAAHSIKGGAAMLDLGSIQRISHRLEDYFKILKDNSSVEVDEKLKSLLLGGCDRLQELLDYLQENYSIAQELGEAKVAEVEPLFSELESHLNGLVANITQVDNTMLRERRTERLAYDDLMADFQGGVAYELRNLLEIFKQEDTQSTRQELRDICDRLLERGGELGGSNWHNLIATSKRAISSSANPYLSLAQVIIRDVRQAQDLVLAQRDQEISISEQLQTLAATQEDISNEYLGSIANQAEDDEFLGLEIESAELSDDFEFEPLELSTDLGNELEAIGADTNFDWDPVGSDMFKGEEYSLDGEFDTSEVTDAYNLELDINVPISDFEATSNFDVEFEFNDGLMDNEVFDADLEGAETVFTEELDMDIASAQDFEAEGLEVIDNNNPIFDAEIDTFDMDPSLDDLDLGEGNEWEQDESIDMFAAVSTVDDETGMTAQNGDLFALTEEVGTLDTDFVFVPEEDVFTDSFSTDASLDDELSLNLESLDLLDNDLFGHSDPESLEVEFNSGFDRTEEMFANEQEDLQRIDTNEEQDFSDRTTFSSNEVSWQESPNLDDVAINTVEEFVGVDSYPSFEEVNEQATLPNDDTENPTASFNIASGITTDVDIVLPTLTEESIPKTENSLPDNVLTIASSSVPVVNLAEKSDDDLSEVFAVDELFELEALGFDLDDAEEEDNFSTQGLAAADPMYTLSSAEAPELTQAQEFPDSSMGMSDFFDEEVNELLAPVIESNPESIRSDLSASTSDMSITDPNPGEDFLQLADLVSEGNVSDLNPGTQLTEGSPGITLDEILENQGDLSFQSDLVMDLETSDLFAVQDNDASEIESGNALDDMSSLPQESEDFLDLFAFTETPESTSAQPSSSGEHQQEIMPPQEEDASVLDDLMLDDTTESNGSDVDLDKLFSDSDSSLRISTQQDVENSGAEVLAFEALDISQDLGQDTSFADFNELLDLGFDSNESLSIEEMESSPQETNVTETSDRKSEEILGFETLNISQDIELDTNFSDFNELLDLGFESNETAAAEEIQTGAKENIQEPYEQSIANGTNESQVESDRPSEVAAIVKDITDLSQSQETHFEGEDATITAFLGDIEDHIKPDFLDYVESNTLLQEKGEFVGTTDFLIESAVEANNVEPHETLISESLLENINLDESASPINTAPSEVIPNDVVRSVWGNSPEDNISEPSSHSPIEEAVQVPTNLPPREVQEIDRIGEDEFHLEDLLAQVNQADQRSLDEMISEASFSDSALQEFDTESSDFNKDFKGFNTTDFSDLSDTSDLDDEFSSILGFIEKESDLSDLGNETDEFSEVFGLTDLDFPESDSESDDGGGGVKNPKDKQPDPKSPNDNDSDPTSGNVGEERDGGQDTSSDASWRDINEVREDLPSNFNTQGSTISTTDNSTSATSVQNLTPLASEDNSEGLEFFDELEALLTTSVASLPSLSLANIVNPISSPAVGDFDDLESLLYSPASSLQASDTNKTSKPKSAETDEFDELEMLLRDTYGKDVGPVNTKTVKRQALAKRAVSKIVSQTMKVDVKHLDSLNNLVGELVVNRNLLEQDQEKLQQFIGNLLFKVQQLGDVAQRMRDQYDRSLLENSIIASRPKTFTSGAMVGAYADSDRGTAVTSTFEDIEFDRYNSFHILSQEIIELVVRVRESASDIEFVVDETEQVSRQLGTITTQIQDDLKQVRMVPFAQIADRLPRAVRDLSFKTGKQADIEMHGRETLIDKAILEQLYDPMTHLVNNAIVHGLEDPETRQSGGKPTLGKIVIRAFHQGNQTVISISDDGAGIDTAKVKQSAVSKGLYTQSEVEQLSDLEAYDLLFEAGFSTKSEADELAGRGVGLDVVRTAINDIRGSVHTDSSVGKGTTFTIRLPLTLSISKAMFCISDRARIAFPVDGFEDVIEISQAQVQLNSKGQPCFPWRDTILPFQPLANLLGYNRHIHRGNVYGKQDEDVVSVIILRSEGNYLALQVDRFLGENEIVIKQLEGPIPKPAGIAGATILGDGKVMAIANVLELFDIAAGRLRPSITSVPMQPMEDEQPANEPTVLIVDDSITVRELLSLTFSKIGYRVEQARDGQDAWDKLRSGLPCNLIFCDIEMPRMDGLELLSRLQKDEFLSQIPVAMLTSRGADRHRQTAAELGAKGYFTKPYLEEEVLSGSQRMLKGEVLI